MRCIAWHAHHEASSPLEIIGCSFTERMREISHEKARYEGKARIKRRKSLFKKFVGGVKALPPDLQKLYSDLDKTVLCYYGPHIDKIMRKNSDAIMALHKKQCGCPWSTRKNNIFDFPPKVNNYGD